MLLSLRIVSATLPLSLQNVGLDNMTLQSLIFKEECHLESSFNCWWSRRLFQQEKLSIRVFS